MGAAQLVLSLLLVFLPLVVFPVHFSLYVLHKSLALGLLTALGGGLALIGAYRERRAGPIFPLALPLLLSLAVAALSLTQAVNLPEGVSRFLLSATGASLFWIVVNSAATPAVGGRLLSLAALSGVCVALIGIYQFWLGEIPGLEEVLRPASTFGNKTLAAQFAVLVLPLPFLFFFFHRDARRELLWGLAGGVILTYLIYTRSRGAWLGSLGALAVVSLWLWVAVARKGGRGELAQLFSFTRRKALILVGVGGFVAAMQVTPEFKYVPARGGVEPLVEDVRSLVQPRGHAIVMLRYRPAWWGNTLSMIRDHPLLGVGAGNWQFLYPRYARSFMIDPAFALYTSPNEAHNDYLQLLAETGPVGLLAFLWILLALARRVRQGFFTVPDRFRRLVSLALSLGLLSLLGNAFVDFPFEMPVPTAFFWIFAGLLWAASSTPTREGGSRLKGLALWAGLTLLVVLYAGLNVAKVRADYHFGLAVGYNWPVSPARPLSPEVIRGALQEVKTAIARYPFDYQYHLAEGILQLRLKNYPEAARANLRTLRLHPYYVPAHINLGLAYLRLGEPEKAEDVLKRGLRIWPDSVEAHNNLGILYALLGRGEEARREFLAALRINPQDSLAHQNLRLLEE